MGKKTRKNEKKRAEIIACIPAYNEQNTITEIVTLTYKYVDVVIVCDDGSEDDTLWFAKDAGAVVVRHNSNKGKGAAFSTLLSEALNYFFTCLVILDGDGQHDPHEIPKVIEPILSGKTDAVIGSRYLSDSNSNAPFYRKFGLRVLNLLTRMAGGNTRDAQSGFRAYGVKAIQVLMDSRAQGYDTDMDQIFMLQKAKLRITEIPISARYHELHITSKMNPLKHGIILIYYLFNLIIREKPLFYIGGPGLISCIGGFIGILYLLKVYFEGSGFHIPWAIISLGFLLLGVFLIMNSAILHSITIEDSD